MEPERVRERGSEVLNPSPERDAVRAACASSTLDLDQVLIDVLRDAYDGLDLRVAAGRSEVNTRTDRVRTAHLLEAVS